MKPDQQDQYRHPSYGVISITRQSGTKDNLFGTMAPGYNTVCLRISEALLCHNVKQGIASVHCDQRIVEVNMSTLQWAQVISGVEETPCTISWRDGKFISTNPDPITALALIHEEFRLAMCALGKIADDIQAHAKELDEKPSITKADRKRYLELANGVANNIVATQPHIMSKIALCVEHMVTEAKADKAAPPSS